jgi:3-dehydrosphinganine reductase
MTMGYWVQAWSAWAVSKEMVKQRRRGKVVFVSSTLGYMTLLGYASYSPAKHAVKALADSLRQELLLYDISVQVFMPCTMFTPGYEEENKTKPQITLKIEETDGGLTGEQAAAAMLNGVKKNQTHITGDFITELFRASTRGSSPGHFFLWDWCLGIIASIGVPIWRMSVDRMVVNHKEEHRRYIAERGLVKED